MIKLELEVKQIDDKIVVCNDKSNIKKFSIKELYTLVEIIENKLENLMNCLD